MFLQEKYILEALQNACNIRKSRSVSRSVPTGMILSNSILEKSSLVNFEMVQTGVW